MLIDGEYGVIKAIKKPLSLSVQGLGCVVNTQPRVAPPHALVKNTDILFFLISS